MNDDIIRIYVNFHSGSKFAETVNKKLSIKEFFVILKERKELKEIGLSFSLVLDGAPITENDSGTLESKGFRHRSQVQIVVALLGSGYQASGGHSARWTTTEPCCVLDENDPYVKRAKLPCNCVIGLAALRSHCEEKVRSGWFNFPCVSCNKFWSNRTVSYLLSIAMTESEFKSFATKVNQNFFDGSAAFKACPFCKAHVQRDPSGNFININWVKCPICTRRTGHDVTFCWNCEKEWKGNHLTCGNPGCDNRDPRIKVLETCATKQIGVVTGVPKIRCCVECGRLLEHVDKCKHMVCKCGCAFCFVCLRKAEKVRGSTTWSCGLYNAACPVAPRQTELFHFQPISRIEKLNF